jgi:hypothetical protein
MRNSCVTSNGVETRAWFLPPKTAGGHETGLGLEPRQRQPKIGAKIYYRSRNKKWILSRKTSGSRQIQKQIFPLISNRIHSQNTEVTVLLPHLIIEMKI